MVSTSFSLYYIEEFRVLLMPNGLQDLQSSLCTPLPLALVTSRFSHALHEAHYVRFPCMHVEKKKGEVETITVLPESLQRWGEYYK